MSLEVEIDFNVEPANQILKELDKKLKEAQRKTQKVYDVGHAVMTASLAMMQATLSAMGIVLNKVVNVIITITTNFARLLLALAAASAASTLTMAEAVNIITAYVSFVFQTMFILMDAQEATNMVLTAEMSVNAIMGALL